MTSNAVAAQRCAACGTDYPVGRMFCAGCGKPNRNQASGAPTQVPQQAPQTHQAFVAAAPPPVAFMKVSNSAPNQSSRVAPLPASLAQGSADEPMSWEMLLVWAVPTLGVFALVYAFKQTAWAKRMNPASTATPRLLGALFLLLVAEACIFAGVIDPKLAPIAVLSVPLILITNVLWLLYAFTMVDTLRAVAQFNSVPLRINKVLGVFFSVYYFQHCIRTIELNCNARQNP